VPVNTKEYYDGDELVPVTGSKRFRNSKLFIGLSLIVVVAVNHLNSQLVKVEGQVANCTAGIQKLVIHADSSQLGVEFNLPNAF